MTGQLIIISSPSGGGKGTLIRELMSKGIGLGYSVSFTTRARREGEVNGRDYHFISIAEFNDCVAKGDLLEYAEVHGNFYGTSRAKVEELIKAGKDVILEIDVQGAEKVMALVPDAVSVFILPPSFDVLKLRLSARGTEDPADLALRLKNSFGEVMRYSEFKYVVINDNIDDASKRLESVILGERQCRTRQTGAIKAILSSFDTSKI